MTSEASLSCASGLGRTDVADSPSLQGCSTPTDHALDASCTFPDAPSPATGPAAMR
jgi:hypothetical protein